MLVTVMLAQAQSLTKAGRLGGARGHLSLPSLTLKGIPSAPPTFRPKPLFEVESRRSHPAGPWIPPVFFRCAADEFIAKIPLARCLFRSRLFRPTLRPSIKNHSSTSGAIHDQGHL